MLHVAALKLLSLDLTSRWHSLSSLRSKVIAVKVTESAVSSSLLISSSTTLEEYQPPGSASSTRFRRRKKTTSRVLSKPVEPVTSTALL